MERDADRHSLDHNERCIDPERRNPLNARDHAFLGQLDRAFREDRGWVTLIARCCINVGLGENTPFFPAR